MKTRLYKDNDTEMIYTFAELKEMIIEENEMDMIPTDDVILNDFIFEMLYQNGGTISILVKELDELNDYAEKLEADRFLTQDERDESIKFLYLSFKKIKKHCTENWCSGYCNHCLYSQLCNEYVEIYNDTPLF